MILIFAGSSHDLSVRRLADVLRARGTEPLVVNLASLEQLAAFSVTADRTGPRFVLHLPEREVDLAAVDTAFLWRSWLPSPLEAPYRELAKDRRAWNFFEREWASLFKGVSLALAQLGVFCVNPPPFGAAWEEKCAQLLVAAEVGLAIPPTLYTSRLPMARRFYDAHDGSIIYKPFHIYLEVPEPRDDGPVTYQKVLTNRVRAADLVEGEGFLPTPSIFQPYVPKQFELRIVAIGRRLFACAIHSQESARSKDDWRRHDPDHTPYRPYELPADVAQKLLRLLDRLGLVFGSIDMIVTPVGEHVFLEINPNGQFDFVAQYSGLPIYEHLAAMLIAGKVDYPSPYSAAAAAPTTAAHPVGAPSEAAALDSAREATHAA